MAEFVIDKRPMFVQHGYAQQAGVRWEGDHGLRYHTYVLPEGADLENMVAFAHGNSLSDCQRKREGN